MAIKMPPKAPSPTPVVAPKLPPAPMPKPIAQRQPYPLNLNGARPAPRRSIAGAAGLLDLGPGDLERPTTRRLRD